MSLKCFFFIFSYGGHFVQPSITILAYLVEGHARNISMKLFENWSLASEQISFKCFYIFSSGGHFVYQSGKILPILVGSHLGNIPVRSISNWPKGLRGDSI